MVLVLPGRKTFGSQFSQAFNPAFQQGLNRFLESDEERETEKRKALAQIDKEERESKEKRNFEPTPLPHHLLHSEKLKNHERQIVKIYFLIGQEFY